MATATRVMAAALGALAIASGSAWTAAESSVPRPALRGAPPEWALEAAARLPLDEQVGQLLVGGFEGSGAPRSLTTALRRRQLAGVILFRHNVRSIGQLRRLSRAVQRAARGQALISVDQEGGLVRRIPFAEPRAGQPMHGSPRRVGQIASQAARELKALGLNVNFAPVADVPAGPRSDIRERAFTGSVPTVSEKVRAAVTAYRSRGVAATVKHFPGLGLAQRNTDDAAVVIRRSRPRLDRIDLVPFRAAVRAKIPLVMASHATYTALDRRRLASQSPRVLQGLLRGELRYGGAVITDALEARAVLRIASVAVAAERSLAAGADLLLLTHGASVRPVRARMLQRSRRSPALRKRIREAAARVLVLKRSLGLPVAGLSTGG